MAETKIDSAAKNLKTLVGSLTTEEEIARASHYLLSAKTTKESEFRSTVLEQVFREDDNNHDAYETQIEIRIYRKMGHPSSYFSHGARLDVDTLEELDIAIDLWISLAITNGLGMLVGDRVETITKGGGSPAAIFRAFMDAYQEKKGNQIGAWTPARMIALRCRIYAVVESRRQVKREHPSELHINKRQKKDHDSITGSAIKQAEANRDLAQAIEVVERVYQHLLNTEQVQYPVQPLGDNAVFEQVTATSALTPDVKPQDDPSSSNRTRFSVTDDVALNAAKIEEEYLRFKQVFDSKWAAYQKASDQATSAQHGFPGFAMRAVEGINNCLRDFSQDTNWTLAKAQRLLQDFDLVGGELKSCLEEYVKSFAAEQEALTSAESVREQFELWEDKKRIVEHAAFAIQALKDLTKNKQE